MVRAVCECLAALCRLGVQNVEASRNQPADELIVASVKRDDSIDHAPAIWQFLFEKGHQEYLPIHLYVEPWYMYTNANYFKMAETNIISGNLSRIVGIKFAHMYTRAKIKVDKPV